MPGRPARRQRPGRRRSGTVLPLVLVLLIGLLACVSLSVDVGLLYVRKQALINGCDAAALAGAQAYLGPGLVTAERAAAASDAASLIADRNGLRDQAVVSIIFPAPGTFQVESSELVPLTFARVLGRSFGMVRARAAAALVPPNGIRDGLRPFGLDSRFMAAASYGTSVTLAAGNVTQDEETGRSATSGQYLPLVLGAPDLEGYLQAIESGAAGAYLVGDRVRIGPEEWRNEGAWAIAPDGDPGSLLRQASVPPWDGQELGSPAVPVTPDNPRVVVVPIVDWGSLEDGTGDVQIVGFATLYILSAAEGDITGCFLDCVAARRGFIEPGAPPGGDYGTYLARLAG